MSPQDTQDRPDTRDGQVKGGGPAGSPGTANLWRWLVRRLLLSVVVVLGSATAAFVALYLLPGDPVQTMLGPTGQTPALVAEVRHETGFDHPVYVRYGLFMGRLLRGDLGQSYQLHQSVKSLIFDQLGSTVELAVTGFVLALVVATVLAVTTAGRRPLLRGLASTLELVLASLPGFWIGVLLLTFFSFRWQLFPAVGGSGVNGLVLPSVTLALTLLGVFAQVMREGMERALSEPFVLSSRARGASETTVRVRHALRHAMVPMVTLSGWSVGALLSGAVIIETIFSRPGLGRVLVSAVNSRDLPVISGVVVVSAVAFSAVNLLTDVLYRVVDPRLKEAQA
ncbi:ABC transporter permease [Actinacidiphila paucisporea]|uniref:Peptide/nickel transport system permease protein n=1 Tax=Actinacidiphila paucisporea TaxID=310782 RepID=A0A1M7NV00_9ACTN|nr:ABC transporter permease [Actinacidiphila paucisporea]SHN08009.1 peptide/nickel transport system permease protein [Actinacidiphila paucisporea]